MDPSGRYGTYFKEIFTPPPPPAYSRDTLKTNEVIKDITFLSES